MSIYLIVGDYALAAHGLPRATGDIDNWIRATKDNAARVSDALLAVRTPLSKVSPQDFYTPDIVYQLGASPQQIDFLPRFRGVNLIWRGRVE